MGERPPVCGVGNSCSRGVVFTIWPLKRTRSEQLAPGPEPDELTIVAGQWLDSAAGAIVDIH